MDALISQALFTRGAERILIVLFAGLAVYFGYRLFLNVPFQNNQQGEIELPGFKVVLSQVGPGVFFAGFGCAVLIASYMYPVQIEAPDINIRGAVSKQSGVPDMPPLPQINIGDGLEQARARAHLSIQTLNCFSEYAGKVKGSLLATDDIALAVHGAKLALLREVWDEETWGDYNEFKRWANTESGDVPKAIKNIYSDKSSCHEEG